MREKLIEFKIKRIGPMIRVSIPYQHEAIERGYFRASTRIDGNKISIESNCYMHIFKNSDGDISCLYVNGVDEDIVSFYLDSDRRIEKQIRIIEERINSNYIINKYVFFDRLRRIGEVGEI